MATAANPSPVEVVEQDGFDTLSIIDMGDCISLTQVSEHGDLHDVQMGHDQARKVLEVLKKVIGE